MRVGNNVLCIDDGAHRLIIGKSYIIKEVSKKFFYINNEAGVTLGYYKYRFLTEKQLRKKKLEEITKNIEI